MGRKRLYFTEEDLKKKNQKHYKKYKRYFNIYGRNRYLIKKMEELAEEEKDRIKKINETILLLAKTLKSPSIKRKPWEKNL